MSHLFFMAHERRRTWKGLAMDDMGPRFRGAFISMRVVLPSKLWLSFFCIHGRISLS